MLEGGGLHNCGMMGSEAGQGRKGQCEAREMLAICENIAEVLKWLVGSNTNNNVRWNPDGEALVWVMPIQAFHLVFLRDTVRARVISA